jgi:serine/threonine protein kinase
VDSPRNLDDTPTGPLDWTPTPPTFALAGHLVAERFEIEALIAEGGMARVYRCIDHHFGVRVALKVFRVDKPDARQRFALEAEVLARLSHPGLVKALDYGHARLGSNELRPFLALELLRGESLGAQLARRRQLPWREAVELGIQVAATLHALHESGVIHRDLKPHNLVVLAGASLRVKVVDLGLCKLTERYARSLERAPLPRLTCIDLGQPGTPGYLPPEAAEHPADERFDVYARGGDFRGRPGGVPSPAASDLTPYGRAGRLCSGSWRRSCQSRSPATPIRTSPGPCIGAVVANRRSRKGRLSE